MRKSARLFCAALILLIPACGLLLEKDREVVAEIRGEPIRLKDLFDRIRALTFEGRALANNPDHAVAMETRKEILKEMVVDRLLVLEAQDRGITVSEEEIAQELRDMPPQHEDVDEEPAEEIEEGAAGHAHKHEQPEHTQWEIEEARNKLLVKKLMEEDLSDAAVEQYYLAHFKEEFMMDPPVVSYEIVAAAPENKDIVDALYKLAVENDMTLFDAYDSMGRPPQILEAGIMPPLPLDQMVPRIRETIEGMERFDISEPFRLTQDGDDRYIVVRLVRNMKRQPLRLVKENIRNSLLSQLIETLEKKFEVRYHYDKLNYRVGE